MRKYIILVAVLGPLLALFYFGLTRDPMNLPSALLKKSAPDFHLKNLEGQEVSLGQLKGRPIILNFWSTWCATCVAEYQTIREANRVYSDVQFYSVLYEDTEQNARDFLERYGNAAPILLDPGLRMSIDYGVAGVPETFFINREGKIIYKHAGVLTSDLLSHMVEVLRSGGSAS